MKTKTGPLKTSANSINKAYKPDDSPRLKQLYFGKYLSLQGQYGIRWYDSLRVGFTTSPGLFLHAVCLPQYCKKKGISKWNLLTLTAFNVIQIYKRIHYPDAPTIAQIYYADIKVVRRALKWCLDGNYVTQVNTGYRGRKPDGHQRAIKYGLTLKGQQILNEYFLHCHQYFDTQLENLEGKERRRYVSF